LVLGFHVICTNYGFWLPNDERGSGSDFVRSDSLLKFGPANPVTTRRSVAAKPFDSKIRQWALTSLRYPPVIWTGRQAQCIALAFKQEIDTYGGTIHAFSILPDHFHMVIAPHHYDIRRFVARLKGVASKRLKDENLYPGSIPSPWGRNAWIVYLLVEGGHDSQHSLRRKQSDTCRPQPAALVFRDALSQYLAAVRSTADSHAPSREFPSNPLYHPNPYAQDHG
jgi:REP element-mobilizing transposase RayT